MAKKPSWPSSFFGCKKAFPDLFLVLVRGISNFSREVWQETSATGIRFADRSEIVESTQYRPAKFNVIL